MCCSKVFYAKAFHTHYQRIHSKTQTNYDNQFSKGSIAAKNAAMELKKLIFQQFQINPKLCACCSAPLPFEKWYKNKNLKFCNRSCAATSNNTTRKVEDRKSPIFNFAPYTKIGFCCICDKVFERKHSKSPKTCSTQCKKKLLSDFQNNRILQGWNPNLNRGRQEPSYLEQSFKDWLEQYGIVFTQEHPFKRFDPSGSYQKTYFVDFYFPHLNLVIELDGSQHNNTIEHDRERDFFISSTYNVQIVRITHNEYVKKTRIEEIRSLLKIP